MKQLLAIAATFALVSSPPGLRVVERASEFTVLHAGGHSAPVRTVSVIPAAGRAQVVIGVDASVDVEDFLLESPYRIVIDLKGATLDMAPRYDRLARGGVTNIRAAQFKPNVVRVVIEIDAAHTYEVSRNDAEVRVAVAGAGPAFAASRPQGSDSKPCPDDPIRARC